ncbi:hypothetical protein IEQ34_011275 [Dendrobium chrysotoxum]|uniref:Histone deacetylase domain-containing protein n=1 Tax=Dendrobium chrysotoxum TaxID=161865 RepID=A0AAV7GXB4_DENCH|nr:hypothetical protein IEQ34_011275 [Dendrobium chrysotoxum]
MSTSRLQEGTMASSCRSTSSSLLPGCRSHYQLFQFHCRRLLPLQPLGSSFTTTEHFLVAAHNIQLPRTVHPARNQRIFPPFLLQTAHHSLPTTACQLLTFLHLLPYRGLEVFEMQNFPPASVDDIARVHARAYVAGLEKAMSKATDEGIIFIDGSGPTYATETTFQESLIAAGAGLSLVDSVVSASINSPNPPIGFALIRPPGHHAIPNGPMGFCVFGNIAVAARYAQHVHGLSRVLIIDFDVHHGNGTCDAFYDDPNIFFLSTHQVPYRSNCKSKSLVFALNFSSLPGLPRSGETMRNWVIPPCYESVYGRCRVTPMSYIFNLIMLRERVWGHQKYLSEDTIGFPRHATRACTGT